MVASVRHEVPELAVEEMQPLADGVPPAAVPHAALPPALARVLLSAA